MRSIALIVLAAALGACNVADDGAIQVEWVITDGGEESSCDIVGATTVRVVATRVSSGKELTAPFSCGSTIGEIDGLRPGSYSVTVELLDADGFMLSSSPAIFDVRVEPGETVPLAQKVEFAFEADSFIELSWIFTREGNDTTCADVHAATVRVVSAPAGGAEPFTDNFPSCTKSSGKTDPLPAGSYMVTISLLDSAGGVLATGMTAPLTLAKGETRNLGEVEFAF